MKAISFFLKIIFIYDRNFHVLYLEGSGQSSNKEYAKSKVGGDLTLPFGTVST